MAGSRPTSPWIREYHPAQADAPMLACLPHAGGAAGFYHPLSAALSPHVRVLCLQYPGRQDRHTEPVITDLGELVSLLTRELAPLAAGGRPFLFFGHSMGAALAFEVALRMERTTAGAPAALLLSARRPPSHPKAAAVHQLDDADLLAHVKRLSGTDAALFEDEEFVRLILPALRGDYTALETYTPDPRARVHCPITVYTGDSDPLLPVEEARGWAEHTEKEFDMRVFPGGHFYLTSQVQPLARAVHQAIAGQIGR